MGLDVLDDAPGYLEDRSQQVDVTVAGVFKRGPNGWPSDILAIFLIIEFRINSHMAGAFADIGRNALVTHVVSLEKRSSFVDEPCQFRLTPGMFCFRR